MSSLQDLRREIDEIDDRLVALLNARARAAMEIGRLKVASGSGVFSPEREQEVLDRVSRLSTGPLPQASLLAIYREMMSASFALERPPRVAYLGPAGSFCHEAALGKFGASVVYAPLVDIRGVFDEVGRGHADYGVVPIENTAVGAVFDTLDACLEYDVKICCEIHRAIHQYLLANCRQEEIEVVYSRPEAFMQCQRWLTRSGLMAKVSAAPSTSKAAEIATTQPRAAAIGGRLASKLYNLKVLAGNIEDLPDNATRFFVLGRDTPKPTGSDRSSLTFVTAHHSGALVEVLAGFQRAGVNMTMLTSRPGTRSDIEYHFFADVEGHADEEPLKGALEETRQHCKSLRILGSYPRSTTVVDEPVDVGGG